MATPFIGVACDHAIYWGAMATPFIGGLCFFMCGVAVWFIGGVPLTMPFIGGGGGVTMPVIGGP